MDGFDYLDQERPFQKVMRFIWNVLTILALVGVVCVVSGFIMIFNDPNIFLNPFRPKPLPSPMEYPTATVTPRSILPPTWTPSPTLEPTDTVTPLPTDTPAPTETPFSLFTPTETSVPAAGRGMPFEVSAGTPVSTSSAAFHPESGCEWMGVAGQIFDLSGAPISGQQVRIGGFLGGKPVDMLTLTGLTSSYGTAGFYEFTLGEVPVASNGSLWVQLLDQAGLAMSEKVFFETFDTCDKNLIFINFKQVR
jgi:hypothetical protein